MNQEMIRLVLTRNLIPNLTVETYLSGKPGMVGAVGFQRIAQDNAAQKERADSAEAQLASERASHREVIDHLSRIYHRIAPGGAVSEDQRKVVVGLVAEVAAKPVAEREPLAPVGDTEHVIDSQQDG